MTEKTHEILSGSEKLRNASSDVRKAFLNLLEAADEV